LPSAPTNASSLGGAQERATSGDIGLLSSPLTRSGRQKTRNHGSSP
jgi:hypothetical protein